MKKRLMALLLSLTICCSPITTYAESLNNIEVNNYNLVDIDTSQLPEGIVPIELNETELNNFLQSVMQENENLNAMSLRQASTTTRTEYVLNSIVAKTTMHATIKTDVNNKISSISSMGVAFSGLTIGTDITNIVTSNSVDSSKKIATLYYNYDKNYYLLVSGAIKLFTTSYRASYKWTVDVGCHSANHETF